MEYYIVSIIISVVIFGIIYSLDNGTNENYYDEETGTYKKPLFYKEALVTVYFNFN